MRTNSAGNFDAMMGEAARREAYDHDSEFGLAVGLPHAGTTYHGKAAAEALADYPPTIGYIALPQGY